jgi:PASTA domain
LRQHSGPALLESAGPSCVPGLVRRLLDQAELVAVRTSRGHGKAWAEIATRLGITRQSAWERWRDLDDEGGTDAVLDRAARAGTRRARSAGRDTAGSHPAVDDVVVPDVVGRTWDDAREVLFLARLVAVGPDPDGPPLAEFGWPGGVVVRQEPRGGAVLPAGSPVTVWVERGGGAGDREPRRPKPAPLTARELPDRMEDEAVG